MPAGAGQQRHSGLQCQPPPSPPGTPTTSPPNPPQNPPPTTMPVAPPGAALPTRCGCCFGRRSPLAGVPLRDLLRRGAHEGHAWFTVDVDPAGLRAVATVTARDAQSPASAVWHDAHL